MELKFKNVNEAFREIVEGIYTNKIPTVKEGSRNGPVLRIPEPVTICYENPLQRVLFNQARDCNPFFHVFESLWMLAGRDDVRPLQYYNSKMKDFSDGGLVLNGAYGRRWKFAKSRYAMTQLKDGTRPRQLINQLAILIDHLKEFPDSRRAVLQMWTVEDDLFNIGSPVEYSKDVCCNLSVMFSIRHMEAPPLFAVLDMTVTNRSNDLIWGTLGANVVHFSFLQEYMAACIGVGVGKYYQFSNNQHVYESNWEPEKWLGEYKNRNMHSAPIEYVDQMKTFVPLVKNREEFDKQVVDFIDGKEYYVPTLGPGWSDPFLFGVATPMCLAFRAHKARNYPLALDYCKAIMADDWRITSTAWIKKRKRNWERKNES